MTDILAVVRATLIIKYVKLFFSPFEFELVMIFNSLLVFQSNTLVADSEMLFCNNNTIECSGFYQKQSSRSF